MLKDIKTYLSVIMWQEVVLKKGTMGDFMFIISCSSHLLYSQKKRKEEMLFLTASFSKINLGLHLICFCITRSKSYCKL